MKIQEDEIKQERFISEGQVYVQGKIIPYTTISENTLLTGVSGTVEASLFSFSYFRKDAERFSTRPVLFVYNGGPGSSSIWLHLGFFGPDRVRLPNPIFPPTTPPFNLEDNPYSLLDLADIVMIDPVGTGYSRLYPNVDGKEYFSTEGDARYLARFIEHWLTKYERWNSPRFLVGESYGTVRSAVLADKLMGGPTNSGQMTAITMNGIIFLGTAFSIGQEEAIPVEQSVLDLPSIAATCWYHSTEKRGSVQDVIEAAHEFSYKEYLPALFLGKRLAAEEKEKVIKQLVAFTGLSAQYFLEHQLRISRNEFIKKCMSGDEKELGLYDSRYLVPLNFQIDKFDPVADDAAMGRYTPAFVSVMNGLKKKKLGITLNMEYISIAFEDVNSEWDYKTEQSPHKYLESAMRRNPDLKLFFASGFYDLVTVLGYVRYIVSQSEFPKERVRVKEYNAGHMLYLGEESSRALEKDLREFILDASKRTDRH